MPGFLKLFLRQIKTYNNNSRGMLRVIQLINIINDFTNRLDLSGLVGNYQKNQD